MYLYTTNLFLNPIRACFSKQVHSFNYTNPDTNRKKCVSYRKFGFTFNTKVFGNAIPIIRGFKCGNINLFQREIFFFMQIPAFYLFCRKSLNIFEKNLRTWPGSSRSADHPASISSRAVFPLPLGASRAAPPIPEPYNEPLTPRSSFDNDEITYIDEESSKFVN